MGGVRKTKSKNLKNLRGGSSDRKHLNTDWRCPLTTVRPKCPAPEQVLGPDGAAWGRMSETVGNGKHSPHLRWPLAAVLVPPDSSGAGTSKPPWMWVDLVRASVAGSMPHGYVTQSVHHGGHGVSARALGSRRVPHTDSDTL